MSLKYRKDYQAPFYKLPKTDLDFTLNPTQTIVKARLVFEDCDSSKPLVLNGQYMKLLELKMDGQKVSEADYELTDTTLTLKKTKPSFVLETTVEINPKDNTRLMGLYMSDDMFCTQCEPEGFRSITYYPDHSDVPSKFTVTIRGDRKKYPVMLSNGNKIKDEGDVVVWEDPFNKPCYLFALVAGELDSIKDKFKTMSGKTVDLALFCEQGKKDRLQFAMDSLKLAMAWDETTFGLEYDLDLFNIVAVSKFNSGAMENKSLNIFNDAALLASKDTATDATYEYVERVIGHEYFHNYSGDRVTLRQWFELSLKEGFTVFRDQEFSYDVRSRAVGRIDDVLELRAYQFPEDDGPLAHPVRPDSYKEIENFYTSTVYNKGAEVIRMQQAILGKDLFRQGCDLYFKRHDGQAVTIDDFVKCMEDVSGKDLTAFKRWYSTPGRPLVKAETSYDEQAKTFKVRLTQSHKTAKEPFVIPLPYGLVGADGKDIKAGTIIFDELSKEYVFENIPERPALSINRFFVSPITLEIKYDDEDRKRLMTKDSDLFNRFDVARQYVLERLLEMIAHKQETPDESIVETLGSYLEQDGLDKAFVARAIMLPSEQEIAEKMAVIDIEEIKRVRKLMRRAFALKYKDTLLKLYKENESDAPFSPDAASAAKRAIKNVALAYLALTELAPMAFAQYQSADNLTDRMSSLVTLVQNERPEEQEALDLFYRRYENDDLVLNKWFAVQAQSPSKNVLERVKNLTKHPKFDYKNPNKVRGLIGAFAGNMAAFNKADGSGYRFVAEQIMIVDKLNPHLAGRMFTAFAKYKRFAPAIQEQAKAVLNEVYADKTLSDISKETVERLLK